HGVDLAFCVPGESYLGLTDALIDFPNIRLVVCRQEGGAGFMAFSDGRMRGKAGVAIVSRGPGATNASIAVHCAYHDATPLVIFVGQAERKDLGRLALQEQNWSKTFSDMTKMVIEVNDGAMISEAAARAFHVAESGTPGPVAVVLPEDMLADEIDAPVTGPAKPVRPGPAADDLERAVDMLRKAEKPLVLVGGTLWGEQALADLTKLSETWNIPVCPTHRRPHLFDSGHANYGGYVGNRVPGPQIDIMRETDLLIALGERLGDSVSQSYTFPNAPVPQFPLVHVWPDAAEIGRVWQPTVGIASDPHEFIKALLKLDAGKAPSGRKDWIGRLNAKHRELTDWKDAESNDGVPFGNVCAAIGRHMADDAVVTTDAGNFSTWIHRCMWFKQSNMFAGASVGAMGPAVPAAIAAGLRWPGRQAIAVVGDGGFQMTGNEFSTARQYGVPLKVFVSNNGSYGTIRMHQEGRYPGRTYATELFNPDFARLAEAYGAKGLKVENNGDVETVVKEALEHDGPVIVDCRTSLSYLSAWRRLEDFPAYKGKN
ncbi:MAG: thiamine pyrophosphate-dependent enzyme, partial [Acetobacterales bacterium]